MSDGAGHEATMAEPRISVVICTYNRAPYLSKALQSLVAQSLPRECFEILVVDNVSTDNTRQVVLEEFSHVQNLRYVYEPVQGANQARNTGRRESRGAYIAYMDDDVIVSPQWLETILNTFEHTKPQPGCIGGKIEPIWESPRPPWLPNKLVPFLAMLDLSEEPIILNDQQWLMSANMAFPKRVLEEMNGFEVYMGRIGNKLLSMDENLLQQRLRSSGYTLLYNPRMAVRHHVPQSRLTKKWFLRRMYWEGISLAVLQIHQDSPSAVRRMRMAFYTARQLLLSPRRLVAIAVQTDNADEFADKCSTLERLGYLVATLGIAK